MSLQRQQQQLHQIVNQGNRGSILYSQSTAKLSISLNPFAQSQSPNNKNNQSHGIESGPARKKQNPLSMDFTVGGTKSHKAQQSLLLDNSSAQHNNRYQMELLKLMTNNQLRNTPSNKNFMYLNDMQAEALSNAKKMVAESLRGMTPKNKQMNQQFLNSGINIQNNIVINQSNMPASNFIEDKKKTSKYQKSTSKEPVQRNSSFEKKNQKSPQTIDYHIERQPTAQSSNRHSINQNNVNNMSVQMQPKFSQIQSSQKRFFSNEQRVKTGSNKSIEIEPLNPKESFIVVLHYEQHKLTFKIDANNTTDWLKSFLINEISKIIPHQRSETKVNISKNKSTEPDNGQISNNKISNSQIVAITSIDKNLPLDYYLQLKDRTLRVFKDQTIQLQPLQNEDDNPKPHKICLKDFRFLKCIGVGGFSRVYLVKRKSTGMMFAMKLIDKEFILKNKKQGIVQNERDIMTVLDHPFISKLEHSFESHNFVVFVMEFCSGGELFWQLRQVKRMKEDQAKFYFTEICLGMLYLHSLDVVYRDIKPENILLDTDGHVRIADFGLSKPNMGEGDYAYSFCGSPEYMAPEMLLKTGHNVQVDHYCLGALLYELVTGLPPYYSQDTEQIYDSILNEELTFPDKLNLSNEIKNLLTGLLNKNPQERLGYEGGLAQLMIHPWFKDVNFLAILDKQVPPPFKPNQLKFHFDSNELTKGELEAREKLMGRTGLVQDIQLFQSFYFNQCEQKSMKVEQKRIFQQHRNFIAEQQQKISLLTKQPKARQNTEEKNRVSIQKSLEISQKLQAQVSKDNINVKQAQMNSQSQLKRRILQQYISGGPSPSSSTQGKIVGLNRITSQNNFTTDNQASFPILFKKGDGQILDFSVLQNHKMMASSVLAEKYKHLETDKSETNPNQDNGHKRVSSLKQKTK